MKKSVIINSLYKSFKKLLYTIRHHNQFKTPHDKRTQRSNLCFGTKDCNYSDKCEFLMSDSKFLFWKKERCGVCGCYLKAKIKLDFEECPKKKW